MRLSMDEWVRLRTSADPPRYINVPRSEVDIWISGSGYDDGPTWRELA